MSITVLLETDVWLAPWKGDPGRTLVQSSARRFADTFAAARAIRRARTFRPFPNAVVLISGVTSALQMPPESL